MLLVVGGRVGAQEALRVSLAGQEAAAARKRELTEQKFNMKFGPVSLRFSGSLGVEATDNVRVTAQNPQEDLTLRPQINLTSLWRVSEKNSLSFGIGLGYVKYLRTTEFDNFFVTPGSDLALDVFVGDFVINLHDRFLYSQDVSADPTISGTGSLSRFENTAGVSTTWDLNKTVITLSYDHEAYVATQKGFEYLTHSAELFALSAGYRVLPTFLTGVQVGAGFTDYNQRQLLDNQHLAAGPFLTAALSHYTTLRISVGYVTYDLDTTGLTNATSQSSAVYADLTLRQRLKGVISQHSLSAGRQIQSGLFTSTIDGIYVRHEADWRLFHKTSFSTSLSYEHVTESADSGEILDRYGFGLTLGRTLTRRTSASLRYQLYVKSSDHKDREYIQNRLELNAVYTF